MKQDYTKLRSLMQAALLQPPRLVRRQPTGAQLNEPAPPSVDAAMPPR